MSCLFKFLCSECTLHKRGFGFLEGLRALQQELVGLGVDRSDPVLLLHVRSERPLLLELLLAHLAFVDVAALLEMRFEILEFWIGTIDEYDCEYGSKAV